MIDLVSLVYLRTFRMLAREESFTKVAEILHLTQPTVSQHILALERYYGVRLFERTPRAVTLTEAGRRLMPYCESLLEEETKAKRALEEMTGQMAGEVLLGASRTVGEYVLPTHMGRFQKKYPQVTTHLTIGNSSQIVRLLAEDQLDLAVVEGEIHDHRVESLTWQEDPLILVVGQDHPLRNEEQVTLEQILPYRLLVREQGSGSRETVFSAFSQSGFEWERLHFLEIDSISAIKLAVEVGVGIAFLSGVSVMREMDLGVLYTVPVQGFEPKRYFSLLRRQGEFRSLSAYSFYRFLQHNTPKEEIL